MNWSQELKDTWGASPKENQLKKLVFLHSMWDKPLLQLAFWPLEQDGTLGQTQRQGKVSKLCPCDNLLSPLSETNE